MGHEGERHATEALGATKHAIQIGSPVHATKATRHCWLEPRQGFRSCNIPDWPHTMWHLACLAIAMIHNPFTTHSRYFGTTNQRLIRGVLGRAFDSHRGNHCGASCVACVLHLCSMLRHVTGAPACGGVRIRAMLTEGLNPEIIKNIRFYKGFG